LVYLMTTPIGSLALLVSARHLDKVWLDLDQSELDGFLIRTTGEGDDVAGFIPGMLSGEGFGDALAQLLPILGERLMGPVAQRLHELGVAEVVLIPAGRLTLLPLHAACWTSEGGTEVFLDGFITTYAPNARALNIARRLIGQRNETPFLVGVGNPLSTTAHGLPAAQDELRNIAALFPQESRLLFEGDRATRAAVLASLPEGTHLHFACHGIFELEDPPSSRLELSGSEALTLRDLLHRTAKPARARLVVLSACQSAVSDFNRLPDELIGLPAGFLQAGAPGVIGTLWQVDDLAAALLMIKFYELHLVGDARNGEGPLAPPAALQRAVQWLRRLTRQELEEIFDLRRREDEKGMLLSPETETAGLLRIVSADHPQARPFFDRPKDWAAFISVGL
jgi:CHAT domain-containing protein